VQDTAEVPVKALVFRHSLPREALAFVGGRLTRRAYTTRAAPTGLRDVPEPTPPSADWALCDTTVSGICGSDAKEIFLHGALDNPLTALLSFPHVLGHEAVAQRHDTGARVVVNPWLSCLPRGIDPPCVACAEGRYPWCRNFDRGVLSAALHLGNCASAPGAHAERFSAHEGQLFRVPDTISDDAAVLADPASVSLRTILLHPPEPSKPALVYGSGTLADAAVGLLRHLYPDVEIWVASRPGPRAEIAEKMGAHAVLPSKPKELVQNVARRVGARPLVPWNKRAWLQDGPGVVYDTIGSPETIETSLRILATGGTLVVSGVETPKRFEWTPLYFKELRVIGSNAFGIEEVRGVRKHAFEHYFDFVAEGLDLTPMITHRFLLSEWKRAISTIARVKRTGAVKVLLRPT
jgi:threonine dehydrogenase-like Zn-dependent dehydrogenase